MFWNEEYDILVKERPQRRASKKINVRKLIASLDWLDGQPVWRDGRVRWSRNETIFSPSEREVARARTALTLLCQQNAQSYRHVPELTRLLDARKAGLEQANQLVGLHAPDLQSLCSSSRHRNPAAARRLVELLAAEVLCCEPLPTSPASAISRSWPLGRDAVEELMLDVAKPTALRALAALIWGAREVLPAPRVGTCPWIRRAGNYGCALGLPRAPGMVVLALMRATVERAKELDDLIVADGSMGLDETTLRQLLARDVPVGEILKVARLVASMSCPLPAYPGPLVARVNPQSPLTKQSLQGWTELRDKVRYAARGLIVRICLHMERGAYEALVDFQRWHDQVFARTLATMEHIQICPSKNDIRRHEAQVLEEFRELGVTLLELYGRLGGSLELWRGLDTLTRAARDTCLPLTPPCRQELPVSQWFPLWRKAIGSVLTQLDKVLDLAEIHGWERTAKVVEVGEVSIVHGSEFSTAWLDVALNLVQWCGTRSEYKELYAVAFWRDELVDAESGAGIAKILMDALGQVDTSRRPQILRELLYSKFSLVKDPADIRAGLQYLLPACDEWDGCGDYRWEALMDTVWDAAAHARTRDWCQPALLERLELVRAIARRDMFSLTEHNWSQVGEWRDICNVAAQLGEADHELFGRLQRILWTHRARSVDWHHVAEGTRFWLQCPDTRKILVTALERWPKKTVDFLAVSRQIELFPPEFKGLLGDVAPMESVQILDCWQPVIAMSSSLEFMARRYCAARQVLNEEVRPPGGLIDIIRLERKLADEMVALQHRLDVGVVPANCEMRVASLEAQLGDPGELRERILREATEYLSNRVAEVEFQALVDRFNKSIWMRYSQLSGGVQIDDTEQAANLLNASLLSLDVRPNRKWLRAMLRAHAEGRTDWRRNVVENDNFLRAMESQGKVTELWLGCFDRHYTLPSGERVSLQVEMDPLHTLQMGNYFGTCLSLGGCNSDSAVANAVELNKRVVFARTERGKYVGRQLVGLNEDGRLVGFRVYDTSGPSEHSPLKVLFYRFGCEFAARCGLEMADEGEVPVLFVRDWWDDGVEPWDKLTT